MTARETLEALAQRTVDFNNSGRMQELLDADYAENCVSVENMGGPDGREARGLDAIRGKWDWWESTHEVHASKAEGPFLHGDNAFGVIYEIDVTQKESGNRMQMRELGLYEVADGKIVRETFYY